MIHTKSSGGTNYLVVVQNMRGGEILRFTHQGLPSDRSLYIEQRTDFMVNIMLYHIGHSSPCPVNGQYQSSLM